MPFQLTSNSSLAHPLALYMRGIHLWGMFVVGERERGCNCSESEILNLKKARSTNGGTRGVVEWFWSRVVVEW